MDLEKMDVLEIWKLGYGKMPEDFNSIDEVDTFYTPLIECLNKRISERTNSRLKVSIERDRDGLVKRKELFRGLLNPFYVRRLKEDANIKLECKDKKGKILYLHPHL